MNPVDLAVDMLATYRVTRLASTDTITGPLRERARRWAQDAGHPKVGELLACSWCLSVWAAVVVQVLPRRVRRVLACAAAAGILSQHYDD